MPEPFSKKPKRVEVNISQQNHISTAAKPVTNCSVSASLGLALL